MPAAVVQSRAVFFTNVIAFSANVTAGNLLVGVFGDESSVSAATASDTLGSTWSSAIFFNGPSNVKIFYALAAASGPCTVTFAGHASAGWQNTAVLECSGASATLDGTPVGHAGSVTPPSSPGSITTAGATLLVVGMDGFHNATTWTPPTGWTCTQANGHDAVCIAFSLQPAGTYAPAFGGSGHDSSVLAMAAFVTAAAPSDLTILTGIRRQSIDGGLPRVTGARRQVIFSGLPPVSLTGSRRQTLMVESLLTSTGMRRQAVISRSRPILASFTIDSGGSLE